MKCKGNTVLNSKSKLISTCDIIQMTVFVYHPEYIDLSAEELQIHKVLLKHHLLASLNMLALVQTSPLTSTVTAG